MFLCFYLTSMFLSLFLPAPSPLSKNKQIKSFKKLINNNNNNKRALESSLKP